MALHEDFVPSHCTPWSPALAVIMGSGRRRSSASRIAKLLCSNPFIQVTNKMTSGQKKSNLLCFCHQHLHFLPPIQACIEEVGPLYLRTNGQTFSDRDSLLYTAEQSSIKLPIISFLVSAQDRFTFTYILMQWRIRDTKSSLKISVVPWPENRSRSARYDEVRSGQMFV